MDLLLTAKGAAMALVFALATGASTWFVTRWAAALISRRADPRRSDQRRSHGTAAPKGGTIGMLAVALPLMAVVIWLYEPADPVPWAAIAAALALAVASGADDSRGLRVMVRLGLQGAAVAVVLILVPAKLLIFQGLLPLALDRIVTGLAWVWFINLYTLMDGIDGLAGVETVSIGAGVFTLTVLIGGQGGGAATVAGFGALILAAGAGGFLVLNWHPARVRLGDGGAAALGLLLGWLLITLATWGYWVAALTLPAYYLADATISVGRRAGRGQPVGRAHGGYFYQRAVARGWSHGRVARLVAGGNGMLVVLAAVSTQVISVAGDALCLAGAAAVVALMLLWLARAEPPAESAP